MTEEMHAPLKPIFFAPDQIFFKIEHQSGLESYMDLDSFFAGFLKELLANIPTTRSDFGDSFTLVPVKPEGGETLRSFHFDSSVKIGNFSLYPAQFVYTKIGGDQSPLALDDRKYQLISEVIAASNVYIRSHLPNAEAESSRSETKTSADTRGEQLEDFQINSQPYVVTNASPNWLMGGAQTGHMITGGPGTLPEAVRRYPLATTPASTRTKS